MNIIAITTEELAEAFKKFDPVTRMIMSRDTGLLNEYFTIVKSQLIDLYLFCTMDIPDDHCDDVIDEDEEEMLLA